MVIQNTLRTFVGKHDFSEDKMKFLTAVDLNKCLKKTRLQVSHSTYAPISKF